MDAVVTYLESVDAEAAAQARERYSCFDHVQGEGPEYGHAVTLDLMVPCENEVVAQLVDLRRRAADSAGAGRLGGRGRTVLRRAERPSGATTPSSTTGSCTGAGWSRGTCGTATWPARCRTWPSTSTAWSSAPAKVVVWEHNSHVGDARATELGSVRRAQRRAAGPDGLAGRLPPGRASPPTTGPVTAASRVGRSRRAQAGPSGPGRELREHPARRRRGAGASSPWAGPRRRHSGRPGWSGPSA